jgi:hypothetical protein
MPLNPIPLGALCLLAFAGVAAAAPQAAPCKLPSGLRQEIAAKYPGTAVVTSSELDSVDKQLFSKDHPDGCPGLTRVDFYGDGTPTLALVVIANDDPKKVAKLIVAHQIGTQWQTLVLESTNGGPIPVVWSQPAGEYRDIDGNKVIRASKPVIVFTAYESWSILYAWSNSRVRKIWLRD